MTMSKNLDLEKKLHLEILNVTNYTLAVGKYDFLYIKCDLSIKPNYIMYYGEFKDYSKKKNAVMGFYIYDDKFDGKDGLYNSIEYGDEIFYCPNDVDHYLNIVYGNYLSIPKSLYRHNRQDGYRYNADNDEVFGKCLKRLQEVNEFFE